MDSLFSDLSVVIIFLEPSLIPIRAHVCRFSPLAILTMYILIFVALRQLIAMELFRSYQCQILS